MLVMMAMEDFVGVHEINYRISEFNICGSFSLVVNITII